MDSLLEEIDESRCHYLEERWKKDFWINRYGKIIRYNYRDFDDLENTVSLHTAIARQCFPNVYHGNAEKAAEDSGWVKVVCCLSKYPTIHKEPTQSQINTLFDLGFGSLAYDRKLIKIQ